MSLRWFNCFHDSNGIVNKSANHFHLVSNILIFNDLVTLVGASEGEKKKKKILHTLQTNMQFHSMAPSFAQYLYGYSQIGDETRTIKSN
jgi:hypothetical protein